jgi:palmitoyltransferase ZDHHC9/14/18
MAKLYEVWPGRNLFLFHGRVISGPPEDYGFQICLLVTLVGPCILYLSYCSSQLPWTISLMISIFFAIALICYGLTSFSDPGIIPRKSVLVMLGLIDKENDVSPESVLSEEDRLLGYKYCETCKIIRPPQASHCSDTDNCILKFDHYCVFLRQTIGARNLIFFRMFLLNSVLFGVSVVIGFCFWQENRKKNRSGDSDVIFYLLGVPMLLILTVVALFLGFHIYLMLTGKTTKEFVRGRHGFVDEEKHNWVFSRPPSMLPPYTTSVILDEQQPISNSS